MVDLKGAPGQELLQDWMTRADNAGNAGRLFSLRQPAAGLLYGRGGRTSTAPPDSGFGALPLPLPSTELLKIPARYVAAPSILSSTRARVSLICALLAAQ